MKLGLPDNIVACLFDLDGVLTQTATVHEAAWKEMFDDYLKGRAANTPQAPLKAPDKPEAPLKAPDKTEQQTPFRLASLTEEAPAVEPATDLSLTAVERWSFIAFELEATHRFFTDVLLRPLVYAQTSEYLPGSDEHAPHIEVRFGLDDGSTINFIVFDGEPPDAARRLHPLPPGMDRAQAL